MATTITVTVAHNGILQVLSKTDGANVRRTIAPGRLEGDTFTPADLSAEEQVIRDAAAEAWIPEVVAAYEAQVRAQALPVSPAVDAERNGEGLDQRRKTEAADEIDALTEKEDWAGAIRKLKELII